MECRIARHNAGRYRSVRRERRVSYLCIRWADVFVPDRCSHGRSGRARRFCIRRFITDKFRGGRRMTENGSMVLNGRENSRKAARLVLENGAVFQGQAFGALDVVRQTGEVVFTTSITGYQEILTDPSYAGQIVTMTNPLMGNYGANDEDLESIKPFVSGFIVRELAEEYSNWRSKESINQFLKDNDILAIEGIDTRK